MKKIILILLAITIAPNFIFAQSKKGKGVCITKEGTKISGKIIYKYTQLSFKSTVKPAIIKIKTKDEEVELEMSEVESFTIDEVNYISGSDLNLVFNGSFGEKSNSEYQLEHFFLEEITTGDKLTLYKHTVYRNREYVISYSLKKKDDPTIYRLLLNDSLLEVIKDNDVVYKKWKAKSDKGYPLVYLKKLIIIVEEYNS